MDEKLERARTKMDEAVHILKLDVSRKVKEAIDDMYEAVEGYEGVAEKKDVDFSELPVIAVAGQWVAAFVSGIGIGIEIVMKADVGYVTITAGALIFAFATKLKYYRSLRRK